MFCQIFSWCKFLLLIFSTLLRVYKFIKNQVNFLYHLKPLFQCFCNYFFLLLLQIYVIRKCKDVYCKIINLKIELLTLFLCICLLSVCIISSYLWILYHKNKIKNMFLKLNLVFHFILLMQSKYFFSKISIYKNIKYKFILSNNLPQNL